jgi:hypothetical protein
MLVRIGLGALMLGGVSSGLGAQQTAPISIPALEKETTVFVGEDMLRQGTETRLKVVRVVASVEIKDLVGNRYTISSGDFPIESETDEYFTTSFSPNNPNGGSINGRGAEKISGVRFHKSSGKVCYVY